MNKIIFATLTAASLAMPTASCLTARAAEKEPPLEAQKLVDEASHLNDTDNFVQAIARSQKALKIAPDYGQALEKLARSYNGRGNQVDFNPPIALDCFDEAIYYDPKYTGKSDNADNMIRMLGKNPSNASDHIYFGDVAMAQKHYRIAVVEYEKATKLASTLTDDLGAAAKLQDALKLAGPRPVAAKGPDFDAYMVELRKKIKSNWHPPKSYIANKLKVSFMLDRQGDASQVYLTATTDISRLDKSAIEAVELSSPFAPLPPGAPENVNIDFNFDFNTSHLAIPSTLSSLSAQQQATFARQGLMASLASDIKEIQARGRLEYSGDEGRLDRLSDIRLSLKLASYQSISGQDDEALKTLETIRVLQERHSNEYSAEYLQTLNFICEIYVKREQFDDAKPIFEKSIQLGEANIELGVTNLVRAYLLAAKVLPCTGYSADGIRYRQKADALLHQEQPALNRLDTVIRENPKEPTIYFMRGVLYSRKKEWQKAIDDFTQAIALNDKYAYAYMLRAQVLRLEKKDGEALADLNKAIAIDGNLAMACSNRGTIYSDTGKLDEAMTDFNQAIKLSADQSLNFCNRGVVFYRQKKYPEAMADFNQALKLKSTYALAWANRSCVDWQLGRFNDTLEDASQAIALDAKLANAWCNRGKGYFSLHVLDKALQDLNTSIKIDPTMLKGEAFYFRAQVHEQMGRKDLAEADRKTAAGLHFEPM